jgi:hypothetical protein
MYLKEIHANTAVENSFTIRPARARRDPGRQAAMAPVR